MMKITAGQLASLVHGDVEGNPNQEITGYAKIEEATDGTVTFLANPKYTQYVYTTKASAILVRKDFVADKPLMATLIRVEDPYETLAFLLNYVSKQMPEKLGIEQPNFVSDDVELPEGIYIGAFAYIGNGVKLGRGVKIYPQVYVGDGATIGDGTILYPGVKVYQGCQIGKRCIIHAGAVIGSDGFGFAPRPEGNYDKIAQIGIVRIGDDVEIGANTTIDRATMGETSIEDGVKLDNLIQIAHNVTVGQNTVMAAQVGVAGSTKIGKNNQFGGQVGIAGHITIGDNNGIGAQSGVPNSVGSGKRLMGTPTIDALEFAKLQVYLKRLPGMYNDLQTLLKQQK